MRKLIKILNITLGAATIATGCVSPRNWSADRHFEAMAQCEYMCGGEVKRYTPALGACECSFVKEGVSK